VVRKDRGEAFARDIAERIVAHAGRAFEREEPVTPFVASLASEMAPDVQRRHILTYATRRSLDCGREGLEALEILWDRAETSIAPWPVDRAGRRAAIEAAIGAART